MSPGHTYTIHCVCVYVANRAASHQKVTTDTYAPATLPNKLKPPRISRRPNHRLSSKSGYGTAPCTGKPRHRHQKPQAEAVLGVSPFVTAPELNNCWSLFICPAPDSKVQGTRPKWPKCAIYIIAIYYSASQQGGPPESLRYRPSKFSEEDNAEWYQPIQSR